MSMSLTRNTLVGYVCPRQMVILAREKSFLSHDGFFHSTTGPEKLELTQFTMAKLKRNKQTKLFS